ncbi:MAG: hypothetical protein K2K97_05335, partial [Muribaculaceae bacterium]|nr:hypothetical protein [Muribaculaceae bacterium]
PDKEGDGVYLSVNIKMPTADNTRSYTDGDNSSNDGTEIGKDYENNVNTVYLVLATNTDQAATNNVFIAWGEIPAADIVKNTTGTQYTSKATLSKSQLATYYGSDLNKPLENNEVNVYVFCNPTLSLRSRLEAEELATVKGNSWIDAVGEYNTSDTNPEVIWNENNFLMSNISTAVRAIPKTLAAWDAFTEETNPFNLSGLNKDVEDCDNSANNETTPRGAINVERTAARFDFRDGSPEFDGKNGESNLYQVIHNDAENEEDWIYYINIKLNKMSLTNMNKQFYYLRRVSDNGLPTGPGFKVCGAELPWFTSTANGLVQNKDGNYVISPTAQMMTGPILNDF